MEELTYTSQIVALVRFGFMHANRVQDRSGYERVRRCVFACKIMLRCLHT